MPSNYGSSRILNISGVSGLTGPTGAYGPTGPTGHTGEAGVTGPIGVMGTGIIPGPSGASGGDGTRYFLDGEFGGDFITLFLTDGTTLGFSGARGATGVDVSDDYQILNDEHPDYAQLYSTKSGSTAYFKSLTVSGRDVEVFGSDDFTVLLRGSTYTHGIFGNTGELIHTRDGFTAWGIPNTYWSGSELYARILTHREIKSTGLTANNNLILDPTNTDGIVYNGVSGKSVWFDYSYGIEDPNTGPKGATVFESGINLGTTGGNGVFVRFPGSTNESIHGIPSIGSCCYCENREEEDVEDSVNCVDYVSPEYCNNIGGIFDYSSCINRPEGPHCYSTGSCCVNGVCVSSSREKCQDIFKGFFVEGVPCEGPNSIESLGGCPEPCGDRGSCCIDGNCYPYSEYECSFEPNGIWFDIPCENANCCLLENTGACCFDEMCYDTNSATCSENQGTWWGYGSRCAGSFGPYNYDPNDPLLIGWTQEVGCDDCICPDCQNDPLSCGTILLPEGSNGEMSCWECCLQSPELPVGCCCVDDVSYNGKTKLECASDGGVFGGENTICCDINNRSRRISNCHYCLSACCVGGVCSETTEDACYESGGIFNYGLSCSNLDCGMLFSIPT